MHTPMQPTVLLHVPACSGGQYTPRHGVYTVGSPARGESKDRRLIPFENSRKISLDKNYHR